jgi:hypothetical protein
MTMHLNDEQFTSYLLGAPDADVCEHLERCAECRAEAQLLSETVLEVSAALRSGASREQLMAMERAAAQGREVRLAARVPKGPSMWTLAPVFATVVLAVALFFTSSIDTVDRLWQGPGTVASNPRQGTVNPPGALVSETSSQPAIDEKTAESGQRADQSQLQSQPMIAANRVSPSQDDDALLRSIQEDASREVPTALEPAVAIVDEHNRIAELRNASGEQR